MDKLKEHNEKKEEIQEQSKKEDAIYISDLDPNAQLNNELDEDKKKRVLDFLRNFAKQLDTINLDHTEEMADEATELADMIQEIIPTPENHINGLVDIIDDNINHQFLTFGAKDNFPERVKHFGDTLRALLKTGNVKLDDAKEMAISDDLKIQLMKKENNLIKDGVIKPGQNPCFYDLTNLDKDKLGLTELIRALAKQILPPRRAKIASPTDSRDFDFDFMGYEDGSIKHKQPV